MGCGASSGGHEAEPDQRTKELDEAFVNKPKASKSVRNLTTAAEQDTERESVIATPVDVPLLNEPCPTACSFLKVYLWKFNFEVTSEFISGALNSLREELNAHKFKLSGGRMLDSKQTMGFEYLVMIRAPSEEDFDKMTQSSTDFQKIQKQIQDCLDDELLAAFRMSEDPPDQSTASECCYHLQLFPNGGDAKSLAVGMGGIQNLVKYYPAIKEVRLLRHVPRTYTSTETDKFTHGCLLRFEAEEDERVFRERTGIFPFDAIHSHLLEFASPPLRTTVFKASVQTSADVTMGRTTTATPRS